MKKIILQLLILPLFFIGANAQAQDCCSEDSCFCADETHFYAKILGGLNFLQNSVNRSTYVPGYIVAGSLGYEGCYGLRLEAEYAYRRNGINKIHFCCRNGSSRHGHFQTSSYMANLLWTLPLSSWGCEFSDIQPFIGAGIGYDSQKMHSSNSRIIFSQKWRHFSWQLMAGFAYPIFCNTEITLEYKFHQGGCHFNNHSLGFGLVYKFGS